MMSFVPSTAPSSDAQQPNSTNNDDSNATLVGNMRDSANIEILAVSAISSREAACHIDTMALQAGAVAAFTVDVLVYPLDTIKTRYQSQSSLTISKQLASVGRAPYTAVRGLYQGIGSVVLATLPAG